MMKLKDMMYIAMFTAVVAALGLIPPIPVPFIPVPITAQTFGVMLAGAVLGAKRGGLSLLVFVLLVAAGAPILAGFRGGIGILVGNSGGYIMSWPIAAFVIGYLVEKYWDRLSLANMILFNVIGGIIVVYLGGITYLSFLTDTPWLAVATGNLAFIPGDLVKVVAASVIAIRLKKAYPIIQSKNKPKAA
ncbi:biotin transport system substrate-specific component [Bacillus mesophilus]|nr:biotin transport system substrate-specific component [Bacillus mesophilus]